MTKFVLFNIFLLACCCASGAPSVTLAWDANSEPNLTGYRLYYGTASRSYAASNLLSQATTTTTLTNLQSGVTYFFAVTATTSSATNNESAFSNEVSYTVPPKAPAGLRIITALQSSNSPEGPWENVAEFGATQLTTTQTKFYRGVLTITE